MGAQVSREPPPPLPGGYVVGEQVYYTERSLTFVNGDRVEHGKQGELVGPATGVNHKGKGVVYYTGASHTFESGGRLEHGEQGEVVGPADGENHKGKGVGVLFRGNRRAIDCSLTQVRRPPPLPGPAPRGLSCSSS